MAKFKNYLISETANNLLNTDSLDDSLRKDPVLEPVFDGINRQQGQDNFDLHYTVERTAAIDTAADAIVAAHTGQALINPDLVEIIQPKTSSKGIPKVAVVKPDGDDFISLVSHEWTRKETWYSKSVRVLGESPTPTGLVYNLANDFVIDCFNGHIVDQEIVAKDYGLIVYDGGTPLVEGVGKDYTVDYKAGVVTLLSAPSGEVTMDYSHATDSTWVVEPQPGKILSIEHAEIDFTIDADVHKTHFEVWAYNPLFNQGNPVDPDDSSFDPYNEDPQNPSANPLRFMAQRRTYNNIKDVIKIANQVDVVAPIGGLANQVIRMVFDYTSLIELKQSLGMQMRIYIDDHQPLSGEFSSTTVYTTIEDET